MENDGGEVMVSRIQTDGQCWSRKDKPNEDVYGQVANKSDYKTKTSLYDTHYNMEHKHRGWAIVLNHEHFKKPKLYQRKGTDLDCNNITRCLEKLGFRVKVLKDATYKDITKTVREVSKYNHSKCDCFVLVALTHGEMNILHAYDLKYDLQDLLDPFKNDLCPTLANKPRLFIIQACRGEYVDSGIEMLQIIETDGSSSNNGMHTDGSPSNNKIHLMTHPDFLIVYSTVPGYFSWRNTAEGSWFIQVLCDELEQKAYNSDILTILIAVSRRVAVDYESHVPRDRSMHKKKQMPCITTTFTRLLCFNRKDM